MYHTHVATENEAAFSFLICQKEGNPTFIHVWFFPIFRGEKNCPTLFLTPLIWSTFFLAKCTKLFSLSQHWSVILIGIFHIGNRVALFKTLFIELFMKKKPRKRKVSRFRDLLAHSPGGKLPLEKNLRLWRAVTTVDCKGEKHVETNWTLLRVYVQLQIETTQKIARKEC